MNNKTYMSRQHTLVFLGVVVGVAVLAVLSASYTFFIGARLAPGLRFRILGPNVITPGQPTLVRWDTSPRYPREKIEACWKRLLRERCVTLNPDTPNDGEARVVVPLGIPRKGVYLRLTARTASGKLLRGATTTGPVLVAAPVGGGRIARRTPTPPPPEPEPGGGGGGGGGGGEPTPQPATASAKFLSPLAGDRPSADGRILAQLLLKWQEENEPACQEWKLDGRRLTTSDWYGGQSPDLSDGPCL